jgi:protein O-mannosyl-transferase
MLGGFVDKIERAAVVIVVILTLLVFYPVYTHDFVTWDDTHNVAANKDMLSPSWEKVKWYWTNSYKDLYIPVTYTLWAGVASVARIAGPHGAELNPAVFHAVNSLLHVVSAIVVFAILRRLIGNVWAALLGALVFAVHPVQVEPVAWVSGLKDVLSGLLALVAVLAYLLFAQTNKLWWHALATAAFVMAMLAKPSAVVVPLVVLIIELLILRRGLRAAIVGPAMWLLFALPVVIVGMLVQPAESLPFVPPVWARPVVALDALAFYLVKLFAPLQLAIDYGRSPQWLWGSWQKWVTWMIPVVAALVVIWIVWRLKFLLIAAGLAVMAVALLPVLGLVPFDFQSYSTTADHYLYFAMLGPAIVVAAVVQRWMKRAVIGAVVVWVLFLAGKSHLQSWVWHDSQSLFQHTLDTNPTSLAGLVNLGKYYADQGPQLARQGMYQAAEQSLRQAITLYERAMRYWPSDAQAREGLANTHATLGWVILMQGKIDAAIAEFETALKIDPNNADAAKLLAQTKALKEKRGPETMPVR